MADLKVRLDDGSEVGPMDLAMVQTWLQHGLLNGNSLVQRQGSTRWVRLSEAVDLSQSRSSGPSPGRARPAGRSAPARERLDEDRGDGTRWRLFVAAGLFGLVAVAAFGAAWRPEVVRPELDDAPWLQMGLLFLALGLALVRGWDVGRRVARVACLALLAAAFPVAGVFAARGMRPEALLALGAAAVLVLGFVLLLGPRLSTLGVSGALALVVLGAVATVRFARAEAGAAIEVGAWASGERRISVPDVGLELSLPDGWVALKPGNPLVPAVNAAPAVLAQPRVSGYALVLSEAAPPGVLTLEHYLDDVIARRRALATELAEDWRRDGRLGAVGSRRAAIRRTAPEGRFAERVVVARDADRYFALVTWVPEAAGGRALEEADALEAATSLSGTRGRARGEAVRSASLELPHLSPEIVELLIGAGGPAPASALYRRAAAASLRGAATLGPATAQEMRGLTAAAAASLPYRDRARLADYLRRVAAGQPTPADEDERMRLLTKTATLRLPPGQRARLERLTDLAIRAALGSPETGS